jgi:hypothetical protein
MFRTEKMRLVFIIATISFLSLACLNGQVPEHTLPALKQRAMERFEAGEFSLALSDFTKLSAQYPKDPLFRYYSGICRVELNRDLETAEELLVYASSRGVPEDVFFYLAEAARKSYDFEKAKRWYLEFDEVAPRSMAKKMGSKSLVRSAMHALQITASYNPFELLHFTYMNLYDPDQYGQVKMTGGRLTAKPERFYSEREEHADLNSLMFLPEKLARGQVVYFSGLSGNGKDGFQIMRARKGNTGKWVDIEPLDALNTEMDEILPYFDPVGNDLYFATDGREGLGGFDLYRSHFDEERDAWSEPVNLGFPVNSVFDDYLFLPGEDLGKAVLFSGRHTSGDAVAVYSVHLSEPKESLAGSTPAELRRIANLGLVPGEIETYLAEGAGGTFPLSDEQAFTGQTGGVGETGKDSLTDEDQLGMSALENTAETEAPLVAKDQTEVLAKALKHQSRSDSLIELAVASRVRLRDIEDPQDRWQLQRQIMLWEKRSDEERDAADQYFADVMNGSLPETIEKDTVIDGMKVYKFVAPDAVAEKARSAFQPDLDAGNQAESKPVDTLSEEEGVPAEKVPSTPEGAALNDFEVLSASPYTPENPIPLDSRVPDGTFYRIQLGVFSREVEPGAFGGLSPITGETLPARSLVKYYAGRFSRFEDARKALSVVREAGYQDAFVMAWYNGGVISLDKARRLEK